MKARLEMLVELFKSAYEINDQTGNEMPITDNDFNQGMKAGILIANKMYEARIKRLEQLVSQMDSYMIEDIDFSGGEEIA